MVVLQNNPICVRRPSWSSIRYCLFTRIGIDVRPTGFVPNNNIRYNFRRANRTFLCSKLAEFYWHLLSYYDVINAEVDKFYLEILNDCVAKITPSSRHCSVWFNNCITHLVFLKESHCKKWKPNKLAHYLNGWASWNMHQLYGTLIIHIRCWWLREYKNAF